MVSILKSKVTTALIAGSFIALPMVAHAGHGYESTISTPAATTAVKLDVRLSDDLAHRANNLPESIKDRGHSRSFSNGFTGNGFYGEKDLNRLTQRLSDSITERLEKKGLRVDDNAPVTLIVTLDNAKPNRPTFNQMSKQAGLSFRSVSVGGAEIKSELIDASGSSLGTADYKWYETDIRDASYGGTWQDAHRAINRYAKKISKDLSKS